MADGYLNQGTVGGLMRAAVCRRYGPPEVVRIEEVAAPKPRDHEVLLRVRSTTVSSGDARVRGNNFPPGFGVLGRVVMGFKGPRNPILGSEVAGEVEAVGSRVTRFKPGDQVLAALSGTGGHAEFVCVKESGAIVSKPRGLSYDEAAALPFGGVTALYFLRDLAHLRPGQRVLIHGASGAVGTAAIQVARHFNAQVTAVTSHSNIALVRSLGAESVVDYTKEDLAQSVAQDGNYDAILDTLGKLTYAQCKPMLTRDGVYLPVVATLGQLVGSSRRKHGKRTKTGVALAKPEQLETLLTMWEAGAFKPVVDRRYALDAIVEAYRHVDAGHKRGNVVITC